MRLSKSQFAGAALALGVVAAIVAGLWVTGTPSEEPARRIDEERIRDLERISAAVDVYWTRHMRLPASLGELRSEPDTDIAAAHPATGAAYEYQPVGAVAYELCATFELRSSQETPGDPFWSHGAGRQCFSRDARAVP